MSEKTWPNQNQIPALAWKAIRHILSQGKQSDGSRSEASVCPPALGRMLLGTMAWPPPINLNYSKVGPVRSILNIALYLSSCQMQRLKKRLSCLKQSALTMKSIESLSSHFNVLFRKRWMISDSFLLKSFYMQKKYTYMCLRTILSATSRLKIAAAAPGMGASSVFWLAEASAG